MKGVLQSQTPGARHRTGESWEQTGHHSPLVRTICQMALSALWSVWTDVRNTLDSLLVTRLIAVTKHPTKATLGREGLSRT